MPSISQGEANKSSCQSKSDLPSPLKSRSYHMGGQADALKLSQSPPVTLVPFISQTASDPLSSRQRMSDLPSPLKSPDSIKCQLWLLPATPILDTVVPLIAQIDALAALRLEQKV